MTYKRLAEYIQSHPELWDQSPTVYDGDVPDEFVPVGFIGILDDDSQSVLDNPHIVMVVNHNNQLPDFRDCMGDCNEGVL